MIVMSGPGICQQLRNPLGPNPVLRSSSCWTSGHPKAERHLEPPAEALGRNVGALAVAAPERRHPSHPEDASLYRDHLRPQGRVLYSKLYLRILRPQWNALLPENDYLPGPLRNTLDQLDAEIRNLHKEAALVA